jgi:transposase InsO family protein
MNTSTIKVLRRPVESARYTSIRFTDHLDVEQIAPSIGSVGDAYDNAMAESIIDLFKTEVIRCQGPWRNRDAVEMATLEWVEWYNNRRLFEALGDIPPAEAESAYYATMTPSESPRMAEQTLH